MSALMLPTAICFAAALAEALCAGKDPIAKLNALRQPKWALPIPAWYVVGIAYYAVCFIVIYRVQAVGQGRELVLTLISFLMAANAAWNAVFFRLNELRASVVFFAGYSVIVVVLVSLAWLTDSISAVLLSVYAAYLPYALAWAYSVWKLNPTRRV